MQPLFAEDSPGKNQLGGMTAERWKTLAAQLVEADVLTASRMDPSLPSRMSFYPRDNRMGQLENKVVVITGGNQGIGKGIAKVFGSEGARLALCARNATKLAATAQELRGSGYDVLEQQADVSQEGPVEALFRSVMERFGRVDILVNNAGNFDGGRVDTVTLAAWNNVIGAALTGAFLCSRSAFRIMKEQGGGRILNIGSISGQRPREGAPRTRRRNSGCGGSPMPSRSTGGPTEFFVAVCTPATCASNGGPIPAVPAARNR